LIAPSNRQRRTVGLWFTGCKEYPDWYTSDRRPDYAFISEGQEHQVHVDARRVMFAGGDFMFCLLRNAQMTLHEPFYAPNRTTAPPERRPIEHLWTLWKDSRQLDCELRDRDPWGVEVQG
jgi:hypothetical protein